MSFGMKKRKKKSCGNSLEFSEFVQEVIMLLLLVISLDPVYSNFTTSLQDKLRHKYPIKLWSYHLVFYLIHRTKGH